MTISSKKQEAKEDIFRASPRDVRVVEVDSSELTINAIQQMINCKIKRDAELLSPSTEDNTHI